MRFIVFYTVDRRPITRTGVVIVRSIIITIIYYYHLFFFFHSANKRKTTQINFSFSEGTFSSNGKVVKHAETEIRWKQ